MYLSVCLSVSLSLSLSLSFPRKPAEVDEKSEECNRARSRPNRLTVKFPSMGVWTGKQRLATSDRFER